MKILYAASTARHICDFHLPVLNGLFAEGFDVTVACRGADGLSGEFRTLEVPFAKSFFSSRNLSTFRILVRSIRRERFDIVSTHTALAGFVTRMALLFAGKGGTTCIHTAHGYLFGKGTSLSGKLTYPFEKLCAPVTDLILTMNREDTAYAKKLVQKGGKVAETRGMGIDNRRFTPAAPGEKALLRQRLGLPEGFLMLCAAELSKRKNQQSLIRAMPDIDSRAVLLLAGDGTQEKALKQLAGKLRVSDRVLFLGYLKDTVPYIQASDMALSASLSEGLSHSVQEALSCGLPVAASKVKGHIELLEKGAGLLFDPRSPREIASCCNAVIHGEVLLCAEGNASLCNVSEAAEELITHYRV